MKDIGSFRLTENIEIHFYFREFEGRLFGHIRKFVNDGPTHQGVMVTKSDSEQILKVLNSLPQKPAVESEEEILKIKISDGYFIIARLRYTNGKLHFDLR